MNDCLFCKIIAGDIPSKKVYEDDLCYAFYDIDPQAPTHFLVIPKEHIPSVSAVTEGDNNALDHAFVNIAKLTETVGFAHVATGSAATVGHIFAVIAKLAGELGLESYRVVSNIGDQAGQSVHHLHFHVLSGRDMSWPPG